MQGVLEPFARDHRCSFHPLPDEMSTLLRAEDPYGLGNLSGLDRIPEILDYAVRYFTDASKEIELADVEVMSRYIALKVGRDKRHRER